MQINGANLLIAAQQAARQAPHVQPNAKAFASALADHAKSDSFAPLDFKQTAAPAPRPAAAPAQPAKLGSQLDIRI
jgi:hypothetical protein